LLSILIKGQTSFVQQEVDDETSMDDQDYMMSVVLKDGGFKKVG